MRLSGLRYRRQTGCASVSSARSERGSSWRESGAAIRCGDEGPAATVITAGDGEVLRGVKTFCSGAGGLQRALVLGRDPEGGPPISVWIDIADHSRVEIDQRWYRARGLVASVSHRVVFHDAPVIARVGSARGDQRSAVVRSGRAAHRRKLGGYGRHRRAVRAREPGGTSRPRSAGGAGSGPHPDRAEHDRRLAVVRRSRDGPGRPGSCRHGAAWPGRDRRGLPRAACRGSASLWLEALRPCRARWIERAATWSCFCCSTGWIRCLRGRDMRPWMSLGRPQLGRPRADEPT